MNKIIFHVDVNSAYLSWEAIYHKQELGVDYDLREEVAVVGGDIKKRHGVVLAKSDKAKEYGIITGESIVSAIRKYPDLRVVKPHYEMYAMCSEKLMNMLKEYTPVVEQYSIDEAYMDMTGTQGIHGDLVQLAYKIKDRIYKELMFTVNVGISSNKLLAKMAGELKKPNMVHTLYEHEIKDKMWPLPVGKLFFVGNASEKRLKLLGVHTIGELANSDKKLIELHLKKQGSIIHNYANGIDSSGVKGVRHSNKGYGNSITLPEDIYTEEAANLILLSLCETVGSRLRVAKAKANCISVSMVDSIFEKKSHQITLTHSTCSTNQIYVNACKIFDEMWDGKTKIRQLGVHTTKLDDEHVHQCSLFDTEENKKKDKLDTAIDKIRDRYGDKSIIRASLVRYNKKD